MNPRYLGLDYLRALLIARLVAFHSTLAYADFGSPVFANVAPIADPETWRSLGTFVNLNEIFSMSLMYFISGLFVWPGLSRRGARNYALARSKRLGIPFVLSIIFLMPLAFYPVYLAHGYDLGVLDYLQALFGSLTWQTGSLWFIWLLLVFDLGAAALYRLAPGALQRLGRIASVAARRPAAAFFVLVAAAAVVYVPTMMAFGPFSWIYIGPFGFQPSRVLHYALYFFVGVGVGAYGLGRGALAPESLLVRHWGRWSLLAGLLLLLQAKGLIPILSILVPASLLLANLFFGLAFVATCAAAGFALVGLFQRFVTRPIAAATSLAACSYGIYLAHDFFVFWAQYLLLGAYLPAVVKALIVFAAALVLSWSSAALARWIWTWRGARQLGMPAAVGSSQPGS